VVVVQFQLLEAGEGFRRKLDQVPDAASPQDAERRAVGKVQPSLTGQRYIRQVQVQEVREVEFRTRAKLFVVVLEVGAPQVAVY
jgi:hypothetical protein